jgi:polysaccharide deacetylase family protein (PEP-CTERM system associated)
MPILNALTIDVEDYFQVSAFEAVCPPETWGGYECRVDRNTRRALDLLADRGVRATFFVLGWVAERFPGLVREIARAKHEVASHGYSHRRVSQSTREEFREDVRRSKVLLEDLTGMEVLGYRAPSYSIAPGTLWAFDELVDAGYLYDSSVFPIRHDLYGLSDWPRFPFLVERIDGGNWVPAEAEARPGPGFPVPGSKFSPLRRGRKGATPGTGNGEQLLEVPITTVKVLGKNFPIAGGGYFRLFPYPLTRWGLARINRLEGRPFVFYVHPWEFDPDQPRISGAGLKSRFRHYVNLKQTEERFRRLLRDFRFAPLREVVGF